MKLSLRLLSACLAVLLLAAGCSGGEASAPQGAPEEAGVSQEAPAGDAAVTFTDALGNQVTVEKNPQRVVSFYGSFAEMWVLAGGTLAGTTDDAIEERQLPLGDEVAIIGSTQNPNLELVLSLAPDFVLLSADTSEHIQAAQTLKAAGIPHAFFRVDYLSDYVDAMKICTDITGRADLYEQNALAVEEQARAVVEKVQGQEGPKVLLIRAYSSGAKAKGMDNLAGVILHELGARNIADDHPSLLEDLSMEEIIAEDPDYIFVTIMGKDTQKALDALAAGIQANPAWNSLSAVQNGRYVVLPSDLFHYKPNARWGESYEYLAEILYPQVMGD